MPHTTEDMRQTVRKYYGSYKSGGPRSLAFALLQDLEAAEREIAAYKAHEKAKWEQAARTFGLPAESIIHKRPEG